MAWIELHDTLPDHPKTIASSAALKIDKDMLVGKLARLWTWSINNRENGFIADYEMATVAEIMRWTKKPALLFDALCIAPPNYSAGFLEKVDGGYMIHDWDERVAMLRERREVTRAQTRQRVAKCREKKRALQGVSNASDVTECNALQGSYVTHGVTQSNAATVPNRTIPYLNSYSGNREIEGGYACATPSGPPSLPELVDFAKERGSDVDPYKFHRFYEQGGWRDSNGKPVENWKQKWITWENTEKKPLPTQTAPIPGQQYHQRDYSDDDMSYLAVDITQLPEE